MSDYLNIIIFLLYNNMSAFEDSQIDDLQINISAD